MSQAVFIPNGAKDMKHTDDLYHNRPPSAFAYEKVGGADVASRAPPPVLPTDGISVILRRTSEHVNYSDSRGDWGN